MIVLPAIIPQNKEQLTDEIERAASFASLVQVDIADGVFAHATTWPYKDRDVDYFERLKAEEEGWPEWERVDIELHLMVQTPETVVADWARTGVKAIVGHIEATDNFQGFIDACRAAGVDVGMALKPSTKIDRIAPFVEHVDFIQVMGSDQIGRHGVTLEDHAVECIRQLRLHYPQAIIAIDIGVNEDTAELLADAGVNKFICGSALLDASNPREVYEYLSGM